MQGFAAGDITRSSEYIVITDKVVYTCPTNRRRSAGDAYAKDTSDMMTADHYDFILQGATTHRVHTHSGGLD